MQKSGIIVVISGALIVAGLIFLVLGNQFVLEGVNQENGKVSLSQALTISKDFEEQETKIGIFAVQIMEFKNDTFSVKVLDPSNIEIISQVMDNESVEEEFDIVETGTYKVIIESITNEEIQAFGAIGPLPDAGKKSLGFISVYILVVGMVGLVGSTVYGIKNRRRSV